MKTPSVTKLAQIVRALNRNFDGPGTVRLGVGSLAEPGVEWQIGCDVNAHPSEYQQVSNPEELPGDDLPLNATGAARRLLGTLHSERH